MKRFTLLGLGLALGSAAALAQTPTPSTPQQPSTPSLPSAPPPVTAPQTPPPGGAPQAPTPEGRYSQSGHGELSFDQIDSDDSGVITRQEAQQVGMSARFNDLDVNADGRISDDEYSYRASGGKGRP